MSKEKKEDKPKKDRKTAWTPERKKEQSERMKKKIAEGKLKAPPSPKKKDNGWSTYFDED